MRWLNELIAAEASDTNSPDTAYTATTDRRPADLHETDSQESRVRGVAAPSQKEPVPQQYAVAPREEGEPDRG